MGQQQKQVVVVTVLSCQLEGIFLAPRDSRVVFSRVVLFISRSVAIAAPTATTTLFVVVLFAQTPRLDAASAAAAATPFAFIADAEVAPAANLDIEASHIGKLELDVAMVVVRDRGS